MPSLIPNGPAAPFSNWPIQLNDPDVGFAWHVGNSTIVTQISSDHGTAHTATVLSDWLDQLVARHKAEIESGNGLIAIHDWRKVKRYDSAARVIWFERMKQRPKGYLRKAVVITADNPLLKMAIAGGNLILAVLSGSQPTIELATNAYEVLRKYQVKAPTKPAS